MEIEETFKDLKHARRGWQLRGLKLSTAGRQARMMLLPAAACTWMILAEIVAQGQGIARTCVAASNHRRFIALGRAGLMALRKRETVPVRTLARYMIAPVYSGGGTKTAPPAAGRGKNHGRHLSGRRRGHASPLSAPSGVSVSLFPATPRREHV
ncbi:MAG: hypothetical protein M0031_01595 [Thermaerobacter sp.]|nr:hypothetical protein [Thermaerobacter sp.]